nr:RNA-directed DNA polymerase, eukaryota, reverse transcriptase zinc-binding domain protein [Tanacetum cinerariifolium]
MTTIRKLKRRIKLPKRYKGSITSISKTNYSNLENSSDDNSTEVKGKIGMESNDECLKHDVKPGEIIEELKESIKEINMKMNKKQNDMVCGDNQTLEANSNGRNDDHDETCIDDGEIRKRGDGVNLSCNKECLDEARTEGAEVSGNKNERHGSVEKRYWINNGYIIFGNVSPLDAMNTDKIENHGELNKNLFSIPTSTKDNGEEVVIFDEKIVKEGSKKWANTLCGYFVGCNMSPAELSALSSRLGKPLVMDEMTTNMCHKELKRSANRYAVLTDDEGNEESNNECKDRRIEVDKWKELQRDKCVIESESDEAIVCEENEAAKDVYQSAFGVFHLFMISDHNPAVLTIPKGLKKKRKAFKFINYTAIRKGLLIVLLENEIWRVVGATCIRRLRQGDPISPYLFTFVMEVFSLSLHKNIQNARKFKYHYGCKEIKLLNMCFADDLLVLCNGDVVSVGVIKKSMEQFSIISGLFPNMGKSTIFFRSVPLSVQNNILQIMPFQVGTLPMRYLGVLLIAKKLSVNDCKNLVEKVAEKINCWRNMMLTYAKKIQLIAFVLSSMQIYWASVYMLLDLNIKEIEKLLKGFLWCQGPLTNGKAKVAWKVVCLPKDQGGLGIKSLKKWNEILLIKQL